MNTAAETDPNVTAALIRGYDPRLKVLARTDLVPFVPRKPASHTMVITQELPALSMADLVHGDEA